MTSERLSQRISELSQHIKYLQARCVSDPANAAEVLSDALEELRINLEELSAADEELIRQNEELIDAQEALRESEQRFRDAIDHFPNVFVIYDADRRIRYVNSKGLQIIGLSEQEVIGRNDEEIFPPEMINSYLPALKLAVETKAPQMLERTRHASMGGQTIIVNIIPLLDESGEIRQILGLSHDITDRKRMEEELRKSRDELDHRVKERTVELSQAKEELEVMNEELQVELEEHQKLEANLIKAKEAAEAAVEAKAAFLANMSHELRTPMNSIIGFTSLLLNENLTQEQKDDVETIRNSGEALLAIINDILEFSSAEKEKVILDHKPLSLKHCVEESLDMVAVQANKKGLNLAYIINYGTPDTIIGDHGRLRQILVNLLSNSVKFTDRGEVSVSISSKAIENNKHQILFAVRDTGIGIPLDKMDKLFQPFTQLEYTISRKRDGVGLGLAISKKLVELMGGEIWAESIPGQGTTFRFIIHAEITPGKHLDLEGTDRDDAYESLSGQKSLSILVAEDNPSNQKVLIRMLKQMGYRADAVADGREVLQALERQPYDLVLMDVRMPEMDGITATQVIRKLRPKDGPKIIAITAYALEGDREKCLEAGMDGYIAKPVKIGDLAKVLKRCALKT